ncbi:hypothetical protein LCGC14_1079770 [marine sediment metagenome]|uniref:histidine kinase n=1 Tax=marine sediment metagenome TaxID=412755 RepID=A0A0F9MFR1_9ZZZZ
MLIAITIAGLTASYLITLIRDDVATRLNTALTTSINNVKLSLTNHERNTVYWADNATITQMAYISSKSNKTQLLDDLYRLLDTNLQSIVTKEAYRDYKLFNASGQLLMTGEEGFNQFSQDLNLPQSVINKLETQRVSTMLPFKSSQAWPDDDGERRFQLPTMLIVATISDWFGNTIGYFAFEMDPAIIYTPAFHQNQVGKTGQAYAIDDNGVLLTESKFIAPIYNSGILKTTIPHAELNLIIHDPGENLRLSASDIDIEHQPLTLMAKSLTQHQSGINLNGYRDYRGVNVIGSWHWDEQLGMGIVTETEVSEVYELYRSLLVSVIVSIIIIILVTLVSIYFYRRSTQQQIASLQHRDAIINQTDDGFVTINKKGIITMVNPALCRLFLYDEAELIDQSVSILVDSDQRALHDEFLHHSTEHEAKIIHRTRSLTAVRKDGSHIPIELNVTPMTFGKHTFYIGVIRDISERFLYQQQLIEAKKQAEHGNHAKSDFLAKMSHELRTPLNAVIGFSQILKLETLTDTQHESVRMIEDAGNHLLTLINDVLDLSRIESGHLSVSIENVEIQPLIEHILPLVTTQLKPLNLTLDVSYPDRCETLMVQADFLRLKQVLLNLLSNAIKYNRPYGHIHILISKTDERVKIAIKDTGMGIEKSLQSRLFSPFDRLDKETSGIQGTGIGLSISHELIKMMNGRFGLDSQPEVGSTFWLELDRSAQDTVSQAQSYDELSGDDQPQQRRKISVLCIEDNPTNLRLMKQFFEHQTRFELQTAENAELGLEIAYQYEPDIVLMDINLPGMDGYEAIKKMKQSAVTRNIKLIAISANAMPTDIEKGIAAGFDRYLTKPVNFQYLLEAIYQLLNEDINNDIH